MPDARQNWFYGFLDLCLLALLRGGPDYGLSLTQRLVAAGVDEVPGGTLYPALLRLERQGLLASDSVASTSGPRRKYYELTPAGLRQLEQLVTQWHGFRATLDGVTRAAHPAEAGPTDSLTAVRRPERDR
ncbi:MAG: helix-turn-helix transcriptional regulator [Austwickia sp.]|jgi:PadR family transcriptional regulator PadR|nr:MAG: helix-turn-helix transcriptional regulator [Austwickia sp.]